MLLKERGVVGPETNPLVASLHRLNSGDLGVVASLFCGVEQRLVEEREDLKTESTELEGDSVPDELLVREPGLLLRDLRWRRSSHGTYESLGSKRLRELFLDGNKD